jgi:hypothetical protein
MTDQKKRPKARVWRTRTARGHISPELTTWSYLVERPDRSVIGLAVDRAEACKQVAKELRGGS